MAADDGMLMNFDISSISTLPIRSSKPAYKGGRWTDRVRAKRAAQYWEKKQKIKETEGNGAAAAGGDGHAKETKVARGQAEEFNIAKTRRLVGGPWKGNKRKRGEGNNATVDANEEGEPGEKNTRPAQRQKSARDGSAGKSQNNNSSNHAPPAPGGSGQFISSLWTYNPATTITTGTTTVEVDDTPQEPTNAPLSDGSATFTTLGLSASVSTHLTTKLNLKAPTAIQKAAIPELLTSDSDIFIQAQTGSGKTLTYLLPILDRISAFSATQNIKLDRSSGLFALILAPTRELAAQILAVLTQLNSSPAHHWITPTCVTGGEKRKSEKARLRKGCNILIATPGRLLDHLEMTESLDVSQVRWMVMDEGDRLADQGFEKEIAKIVEIVSKRSKISLITGDQGKGGLPSRRVTILCSATMGAGVQKLGDLSLQDASFIKADDKNNADGESPDDETGKDKTKSDNQGEKFLAPAQLRQSYLLVPPKQRYVALYAMLKRAFMRASANMKVIVFFSCADSVDFHFEAFSRGLDEDRETEGGIGGKKDSGKTKNPTNKQQVHPTIRSAPLLHDKVLLCKLHGSLPQVQRTETLRCFTNGTTPSPPKPKAKPAAPTTPVTEAPAPAEAETEAAPSTTSAEPKPKSKLKPPTTSHPALLFSTDVSSRGLDLPNVDLIIQFDPPFSRADYIHRIGRTARAGRPGRAVIFLLAGTGEINYVERVIQPTLPNGGEMEGNVKGKVKEESIRDIFEKGFAPPSSSSSDSSNKLNAIPSIKKTNTKLPPLPAYEHLATDFQLSLESWLYSSASTSPTHPLNLAKRAWTSHVRAYATHESSERDIFDKGKLQLGHLAKGFGLRERPGSISSSVAVASTSRATTGKDKRDKREKRNKDKSKLGKIIGKVLGSEDEDEDDQSPQQGKSKINSKKRKPKWDQEDRVGTRFVGDGDVEEARERMRMLARGLQSKNGAAAEFNIG